MYCKVVLACVLAIVSRASAGDQGDVIGDDPNQQLSTDIEFSELECDDQCERLAEARWQYVLSLSQDDLQHKTELWREELRLFNETSVKYSHNLTVTAPDIVRKVQLLSYVGEALLPEEQRELIVKLSAEVEHTVRTSRVTYKENTTLDVSGVESSLAETRDVEELRRLWLEWYKLFLPLQDDYISVLQLTNHIATLNGNTDAESYWLMQAEYPGSYDDARLLWQEVEPLYVKLHKYVRSQLESHYDSAISTDNSTIQPYLLGSLGQLDWSNIADIVLGEDDTVYSTLQKNLQLQEMSGKKLYEVADKLVQSMGFEGLQKEFWEESQFNSSCHSEVVEYCSSGRTRVATCSKPSWSQFAEAHEIVMTAVRRKLISEQTYTFMNPNRQSASQEAAVELLPLIASSPANLQRLGLLPTELATSHNSSASLRLLVALRILPRLPYYLAADLWRLHVLSVENVTVEEAAESWKQYKENFSRVGATGDADSWDLSPDDLITTNKPYLAKFAGVILQFQMLELFENNTDNSSSIVKVIQKGDKLKQLLKDGLSSDWLTLLKADLGIDGVDAGSLTRYFKPLEEFLDAQESAAHAGNRGLDVETSTEHASSTDAGHHNATSRTLDADRRASSIGSSVLIGCAVVALLGVVLTVILVARRRYQQRNRSSDYHLAKTNPE